MQGEACLFCLLPLRRPIRLHAFGLCFTLRGTPLLLWRDHGCCGLRKRILRRPAPALRRALECFDSSVQFVTFRDQEGNDVFSGHRIL